MDKLHLILPLPISINQLYQLQYAYSKKYKKNMPTGKKILTEAGKKKKLEIIKSATEQMKGQKWNFELTKTHFIYQDINVYFNRKGRDSDNILKLLCDSLHNIVFHNDSKVLSRIQRIYYSYDNPRIECTYTVCEWLGIFDKKKDYQEFLSKCEQCKHYRDNRCSILTDSVQGVIRQEIKTSQYDKKLCEKFTLKKGE